jgi:hypothetical protein
MSSASACRTARCPAAKAWRSTLKLDEPTLREVARMTGRGVPTTRARPRSCASSTRTSAPGCRCRRARPSSAPLLAVLGASLVLAAAGLSMLWFGRLR